MALYTKELHFFAFKNGQLIGNRIFNGGPSYRAAPAPRALPLRARSPALHLSLGNVLVAFGNSKFSQWA